MVDAQKFTCQDCDGSGKRHGVKCAECNGKGYYYLEKVTLHEKLVAATESQEAVET